MLYTLYGKPDSGKTTLARHMANEFGGKTLIIANEGRIKNNENEIVWDMPDDRCPTAWMKEKFKADWKPIKEQVKTVIIDSITGVNDIMAIPALDLCKSDDKMKNKSKAELDAMTLASIPFGMGESNRAELMKSFISLLVNMSKDYEVIITAHTQLLSVMGSDQQLVDQITIGIGGKSERSASSRNFLMQHSDVIAYVDASPEKMSSGTQVASRKIVVCQNAVLVTKYKGVLFGQDEFFEPMIAYDIKGKEPLHNTIKELFNK